MNTEQFEGNWKHLKGSVQEQWGRLTDDDIQKVVGKRDKLVGRLQERYGITRQAAEDEVNQWSVKYEQ
ncbi:CsbD family protein [Gilvimarinus agarilyticus]|uniref:CsbD family protein n=1 Tax=unclassified Gilvimarinus TaxID=2642066 RepID=UPI001C0837E6|nr:MULTISPECIES: CsbD family protein [unclassified Gilvimarinus]MBU2885508.1 CsbD family protein [Gilvimarinus agarilyticus]MDO6570407.1 CsbD family protein [Gilvimarinus sp. 2_MG-2023]MDO6748411.1 CsbD family protein [Gilvimarinus sp. 1_MG-2023]